MPQHSHGDEQGPRDEVKVFKHEEDEEVDLGTDRLSVEDRLTEDKSSLITESETKSTDHTPASRTDSDSAFGPVVSRSLHSPFSDRVAPLGHPAGQPHPPLGYYYNPYAAYGGSLTALTGKMGLPPPVGLSPFLCAAETLSQPPPAHMGIPPYQLDSKGIPRPSLYPFTGSGGCGYPPHPQLSAADLSAWSSSALYPSTSAAFRSPYSALSSFHRFSPGGLLTPPSLPPHLAHQASQLQQQRASLAPPGGHQHNSCTALQRNSIMHRGISVDGKISTSLSQAHTQSHQQHNNNNNNDLNNSNNTVSSTHRHRSDVSSKKKSHIKKPLNAFMLYMKEMRAQVVAECTLKESAAINQILGRRWHALNKEQQSKYYDMARVERQNHLQMYPGWSARDNYAQSKKKKRKREKVDVQMKKCRARYGLEQQDQWCKPCSDAQGAPAFLIDDVRYADGGSHFEPHKPCRRKKKCVRYMEAIQAASGGTIGNHFSARQHGSDLGSDDDDTDDTDDDDEEVDEMDDGVGSSSGTDLARTPASNLSSSSAEDPPTCVSCSTSPGYSVVSLLSPLTPSGSGVASSCGVGGLLVGGGVESPRTPLGADPRDINNPLSVDQLTNNSPRPSLAAPPLAAPPSQSRPPSLVATALSVT